MSYTAECNEMEWSVFAFTLTMRFVKWMSSLWISPILNTWKWPSIVVSPSIGQYWNNKTRKTQCAYRYIKMLSQHSASGSGAYGPLLRDTYTAVCYLQYTTCWRSHSERIKSLLWNNINRQEIPVKLSVGRPPQHTCQWATHCKWCSPYSSKIRRSQGWPFLI